MMWVQFPPGHPIRMLRMLMKLKENIALRKSIRLEIESYIKEQDEKLSVIEKSISMKINESREDIRQLRLIVTRYLLTTSARENELIAEIESLKRSQHERNIQHDRPNLQVMAAPKLPNSSVLRPQTNHGL